LQTGAQFSQARPPDAQIAETQEQTFDCRISGYFI
jgi:hypothetical protein